MDSQTDKASEPIEIFFQDAVRFFRAVTGSAKCPMCSTNSWQIPMESEGSPVTLLPAGIYLDGQQRLQLKLVCNECGYFRGHDALIIRTWLKNNPEQVDSENA